MTELAPQALVSARGEHLILYDGVCGLCNRLNQFVLLCDTRAVFAFASLQSPTARSVLPRLGGNAESLDTVYVVVNYRSESPVLLSKSGAASFVLETLGIRGPLSWAFRVLPDGLLKLGYDLIARNRYRVFGQSETASCRARNLRNASSTYEKRPEFVWRGRPRPRMPRPSWNHQ